MAAPISPQPLVVGEVNQTAHETTTNNNPKMLYADQLRPKQSNAVLSKAELFPVTFVHGEPTIEFSIYDVNQFSREEGLHQAVIMKFSYGKPDLQEFRKVFSSQFDIQGRCNIGLLEFRHVLVRFDLYNDFVQCISKSTGYVKAKGEEFFFRTFPWTIGFNPKEETSMAVVWISFPSLPPNFFAKRSLMSIASVVGKPISMDKTTQDRTRPSAARVKVILDLPEKHPKKIKIVIFDRVSGKSIDQYQEVVYDNIPNHCTYCKHRGHYDEACRLWKQKGSEEMATICAPVESNLPVIDVSMTDKLQGDDRNLLNQVDARQNAVVQLEVEVKKQNDKAKGVTEVPKGVTEVIDPLGELTTAGEGKKGNKEACLLGRVTGKESTKDQGNVSSSGKDSRVEEKDDKHVGHPSLLNKQQDAKEKQNAHVKALPFTVGPSFKDMDAEGSSMNGNPMAFNKKLVDEGHGNIDRKKVMTEIDMPVGQLGFVIEDMAIAIVENPNSGKIEQKVDHPGHDSGQKDGNKSLKQLNNKTVGHLCLEIEVSSEKMKQIEGHVIAKVVEEPIYAHVNTTNATAVSKTYNAQEKEQKAAGHAGHDGRNIDKMDKLVKKVDKHEGHEGQNAGQGDFKKKKHFTVISTLNEAAGNSHAATGCNAHFQKGPLKGINNTIPTVSTDGVQNASAIATTHGVQQKKLLLLQKASAESSDDHVQNLNELQEAVSSNFKSWADIAEQHDEGEEIRQEIGSPSRQSGNAKERAVAVIEQFASPTPAANHDRQEAILFPESEQCITDHERSLLNALGSPNHHKIGFLSGSKTTARKQKSVAKSQEPGSARQKQVATCSRQEQEDLSLYKIWGPPIDYDDVVYFGEIEESEVKDAKMPEDKDDKVSDIISVRRPPMRNAKQNKAASTTSTRSTRSKKIS